MLDSTAELVAELRAREFLIPPAVEAQVMWEEMLAEVERDGE